MAYQHYSPRCRTAFFNENQLDEAISLYNEAEKKGEIPCFLCESEVCALLHGLRTLDLGGTGEIMAQRLYDLLRKGERIATLLIGIEPRERGGVMAGVRNRMHRAFGVEHGTEEG